MNDDSSPLIRAHLPATGGRPQAIIPRDLDSALRFARAVFLSRMAPKELDTEEKILFVILQGAEIGLPPMAALQRIAPINGRATIWGDAALALVLSNPLCEDVSEYFEGEEGKDSYTAVCQTRRRGKKEAIVGKFSVADAKKAGLWDMREKITIRQETVTNPSPWFRFWKRMLQMRARAFCLRDAYPDILLGLYLREEIEGDRAIEAAQSKTQVPRREPPAPPEITSLATPTSPAAPAQPPQPMELAKEPKTVSDARIERFKDMAAKSTSVDMLDLAYRQCIEPVESEMFPPDLDDAVRIYRWRKAELEE